MKSSWSWPKFFLGCLVGVLILMAKSRFIDNEVIEVGYPAVETERPLEVEKVLFEAPAGAVEAIEK